MPLHGEISLDAGDAYAELRAIRREVLSFAKETASALNLTATVNLDKDALKQVKTALASISKEELQNAKEMARVREIDSRTRLNELKAIALEERRQLTQTRREEQVAARERRAEHKEARDALRAQKELGASMAREIEAGYRRGGVTINRFGDEVKTVTGHLRDMQAEMRKARQARSELFDRASNAASIGGAAILGGAGVSVNSFVEFDRGLRNINTVAQLTEGSLQDLSNEVLRMAEDPNIRKGPQDLNAALYDIYSSGKSGGEALDILRTSAIGASAGLTETKTSAGVLLSVLQSGIGGVSNSKEAMDVLFKTVDRGRLSFGDLAGSLGAVLPTAAKAGISLQEVGAYLAVATKQGQSAADGINDLMNLIQKIANPSKEAREAFDKLGISYGFSALQGKGLAGVLAQIQEKTGGNADALAALFKDMQAQRGAMTGLTNAGKDLNTELGHQKRAFDGVGAAAKAMAQQNKGAAYEADMLRKDLQILGIEAGKSLVPVFRSVVRETRDAVKWFNNLDQATKDNYVRWGVAGGAVLLLMRPLRDAIGIIKLLRDWHRAAGTAATTQAVLEEAAAARTAKAWGAAALVKGGAFVGILGRAGGIAGAGLALGEYGQDALAGSSFGQRYGIPTGPEARENMSTRWDNRTTRYERIPTAAERAAWRDPRTFSILDDGLDPRAAAISVMRSHRSTSAPAPRDPVASNPLAGMDLDGSPKKSAAQRENEKRERKEAAQARKDAAEALRLEKALLENVAKGYDAKATAVENAAKREIAALRDVQGELRSTFAGIQEKFLDLGDTSNPLGGVLRQLDSLFNFGGRAQGVVAHYGDAAQGHRDAAQASRNQKSTAKGGAGKGSGLIPVAGPGALRPADWRQFQTVVPGGKGNAAPGSFRDWLRGFEGGSLNSQVTLPESWGPMISRKAEGADIRRMIQELLGGDRGADVIRDTVRNLKSDSAPQVLKNLEQWGGEPLALSGTDYDKALQFWRYIANNADELLNAKKALQETTDTVKSAIAEAARGASGILSGAPAKADELMQAQSAQRMEIFRDMRTDTIAEWQRVEEENEGIIQDTLKAIDDYNAQVKEYSDHTVATAIQIADENKNKLIEGIQQAMAAIQTGVTDITTPKFSPRELSVLEFSPFDDGSSSRIEEISATKQAYSDMFYAIAQGATRMENGVKGAIGGILDNLKQMAQEMATQWIFSQLLGLAGIGAVKGNTSAPTFTVPFVPGYSGFDPANPFPSHATGLDRVPYDNYVARLHRDEMIVPAQQANQMRQFMNARSVPPSQGFGGGTVSVTYVHNGNIVTNDPLDYQQQVRRMGSRMSSHEQERRMAEMTRRGGGGF